MNVITPFLTRLIAVIVPTEQWRIVAEGFYGATNPILLRFNLSAAQRGDLK